MDWLNFKNMPVFQLETASTLGSLDSTDFEVSFLSLVFHTQLIYWGKNQKRRFARQSWEFNLRSKVFIDTFPSVAKVKHLDDLSISLENRLILAQELRQKVAAEKQLNSLNSLNLATAAAAAALNQNHNAPASAWSNLVVFAGLVAFILVAKYVLQSAASDL